jgi:hypothetical protein
MAAPILPSAFCDYGIGTKDKGGIAMADLGKLQTETFLTQKDVQWIAGAFRELVPQVRNLGGKIFGGKSQWIRPQSDEVFAVLDEEPEFAANAFFPVARGYKARNESVGYTIKIAVWDEGERRRISIGSQAGRQADRPQASGARRRLVRMLSEVDNTLTTPAEPERAPAATGSVPGNPSPRQQPFSPPRPAAFKRPIGVVGALAAVAVVLGVAVWVGAGHEAAGTLDGSAGPDDAGASSADTVSPTSLPAPPETITDAAATEAGEPAGPTAELSTGATASASSTAPDNVDAAGSPVSYSAANMVDGDPQTAWRMPGDGRGETVTLTLPSAAHLTRVGLIPGYAKVDPSNGVDRFPENRRVREVRWRFEDGTTIEQRFSDRPRMQWTAVDATTSSVTIELLSSRPGDPDHDYLPISEVSIVGTT